MEQKILFLTTCTDKKVPDEDYSKEGIKETLQDKFDLPRIPSEGAHKYRPEERDYPFAIPAREMYQGKNSTVSGINRFLKSIERSNELDIFFISPGYRIVEGDELIYYYDCELGYGEGKVRAEEIAPYVLDRIENETEENEYDVVVVTLSESYFDTLYESNGGSRNLLRNQRNIWQIIDKNLSNPSIFVVGGEKPREKAKSFCDNLGLDCKTLQKDRNLLNKEHQEVIGSHIRSKNNP